MNPKPHVMVCGLISSGNRLLQHLLEKCGAYATISHGPQSVAQEAAKKPAGAVLIVRSQPFWGNSVVKQGGRLKGLCESMGIRHDPFTQGAMIKALVCELASTNTAVAAITYEGLIDDPASVCEYLCDVFGIAYPAGGLGVDFYDANHLSDSSKPRHDAKRGVFRTPSGEPRK